MVFSYLSAGGFLYRSFVIRETLTVFSFLSFPFFCFCFRFLLCFVLFVCEPEFLCIVLAVRNSLIRPGWPQTHRGLPISAGIKGRSSDCTLSYYCFRLINISGNAPACVVPLQLIPRLEWGSYSEGTGEGCSFPRFPEGFPSCSPESLCL